MLKKKYDDSLVQLLKKRAEQTTYHGVPLLVRRLPDCDEPGAMDPRLYRDMKKQLLLLGFLPEKLMKIDTSEKGTQICVKCLTASKASRVWMRKYG